MAKFPMRLNDKPVYEQKDYNPYPVRLDDLKKPLKEEAWENGSSLHAWIKQILREHINKNNKKKEKLKLKGKI